MGQINVGRVILGGLVAGLVINVVEYVLNMYVIADQVRAAMQKINLPADFSTNQIAGFVVMGFVIGIVVVWLYAAMRPRFGAGPKTAMTAGVAAWALGNLLPNVGFGIMGLYETNLLVIGTCVGLVEMAIAGLVGGALYKEESAQASQASAARA
jgi:hypothetical protein